MSSQPTAHLIPFPQAAASPAAAALLVSGGAVGPMVAPAVASDARLAAAPMAMAENFAGFRSLEANFLYCPNQFFDVLLPHCSRGCVRLVGFMIRQTLGYLDPNGEPQHSRLRFTFNQLIKGANVARGALRASLDEALAGKFIECLGEGRANSAGQRGQSAVYALRWDDSGVYQRSPDAFQGFFLGEGNRTTIPNQFFDSVLPQETLSVVRLVGAIVRHTIGFQNPRGGRREQVRFSFEQIKEFSGIQHNSSVTEALETSLARNYLVRVSAGVKPLGKQAGIAAVYAVKWLSREIAALGGNAVLLQYSQNGSENRSASLGAIENSARFRKPTGGVDSETVQKTDWEEFNIPTGERFKKPTDRNNKAKNISKQQQQDGEPNAVAAEGVSSVALLCQQGFDARTARYLASLTTQETIQKQIAWLSRRSANRSPLGLLRLAIQENWPEPTGSSGPHDSVTAIFAAHSYAGHAGQTGQTRAAPTAKPSRMDLEAVEPLVAALLKTWPDSERLPEFGQHFGHFWLSHEENHRGPKLGSVASAARLLGDSFLRVHYRRKLGHQQELNQQSREAREGKFGPRWLEYLRAEERRIQTTNPESYAAFLAKREAGQNGLSGSGLFSGPAFAPLLETLAAKHQREECRLHEFQQYFSKEVRDFWSWADIYNLTSLT